MIPPLALLTARYLCVSFKKTSTIALIIMANIVFLLSFLSAVTFYYNISIQPLAIQLKPVLHPQDEVFSFAQYYQDLPFYLERRITVVAWNNELKFGMQHQNTSAWMIDEPTFWQRWHQPKRAYALTKATIFAEMQQKFPHEPLHLIARAGPNVLFSNRTKG